MNGYQFTSTLAFGFVAIIIAWIYAPKHYTLADDIVACGEMPAVSYTDTPVHAPSVTKIAEPDQYKTQIDAINQCRQQVIKHWNAKSNQG